MLREHDAVREHAREHLAEVGKHSQQTRTNRHVSPMRRGGTSCRKKRSRCTIGIVVTVERWVGMGKSLDPEVELIASYAAVMKSRKDVSTSHGPTAGMVLISALLANACVPEPDVTFVTLIVEVPVGHAYDEIRVRRMPNPGTVTATDTTVDAALLPQTEIRLHKTGIAVPLDGSEIGVLVQAISAGYVIAQAGRVVSVKDTDEFLVLPLFLCPHPFAVTLEGMTCDPADGGPSDTSGTSVDADSGHDAGVGPGTGRWTPPACLVVDEQALTLPVPPQPPGTPECTEYCTLMEHNCPAVYETIDNCLFACSELAWPLKATPNDDTISCRIGWASMQPSKLVYCDRASVDSPAACGTFCNVYCRTGAHICPGFFPAEQACKDACYRFEQDIKRIDPARNINETHISCRFRWLKRAIFNRDFCTMAAPNACNQHCADLLLNVEPP